jgi:hypothetical protein
MERRGILCLKKDKELVKALVAVLVVEVEDVKWKQ